MSEENDRNKELVFFEHEIALDEELTDLISEQIRIGKEKGIDINKEDIINLAILHYQAEKENWSPEKFEKELKNIIEFCNKLKEHDRKKK